MAGTEDLGSVPDESGRRWLAPEVLGKILGMKDLQGPGSGQKYKKEFKNTKKKRTTSRFKKTF